MQHIHIIGDIFQSDTAHTADRVGKVLVDDLFRDTNSLKDLRALVGLDGGNTHLGRDLDDAVKNCGIVIIYGCIIILIQHLGLDQVVNRLLSQIRVDGAGTKAQQSCEVMYLSRLAALQDQSHGSALLGLYQMLLQGRYRQQGRNRHMVFIDVTVRQDDDVDTVAVRTIHLQEQALNRLGQGSILIIGDRDHFYLESRFLHIFNL